MKEVADIVFCEREQTNKKINVKIVCNTEMLELNKAFRNKDKNTNVLAFVNDDESKEQTQEFGDIAICYPYLCLLYTSPSPRDISGSRMPSSA